MKCSNCGFETAQGNAFCPHCGERLIHDVQPQGTFAVQVLAALKDPLFLAVCILLSVSCLMSLSAGSVPLINILITVFLWLTYAQARKDIADADHLRCVSGVLYAEYVIYYVTAGLVLFMGVIFAIGFNIISNSMDGFWEALLGDFAEADVAASLLALLPSISGTFIFAVCAFASAIMVVVNIFTTRYLHRFAKSVYQSIQQGVYAVECAKASKILLFVIGGITVFGSLSDLTSNQFGSFIANASSGGCAIMAGLLIRKYLDSEV